LEADKTTGANTGRAGGGRKTFADRLQPFLRAELILPALILFVLSVPLFCRLVAAPDPTSPFSDHMAHLRIVRRLAASGDYPPHPFYHLCVIVLSAGNNGWAMAGMAALVLAWATGARAYLSALLFTSRNAPSLPVLVALCFGLALAMPLPNWWDPRYKMMPMGAARYFNEMPSPGWWDFPAVFRGQVSPNVWHNPTGIFAMPFALLAFLLGLRALEPPRLSAAALAGGAMVLSLLAKPNYVLAFAPCFAVALAVVLARATRAGRLGVPSALGQAAAAFGPAAAVLALQYLSVYRNGPSEDGGVIFAPFLAWSAVSPDILASVLLGIAFPLAVAVFYFRGVVRDPKLLLAWSVLGVAILQYALLAESGERLNHNNFGWGPVLANQVLFVVCCDFLLRRPSSAYRYVAFGVLGLQVLSGCVCLTRCLLVPSMADLL
jgi:hypothetical protein